MTSAWDRRSGVATLLVGVWIGMSLAMWLVATTNFRTVDAILAPEYRVELAEVVAPRTLAEERPILRFLSSELNRRFFSWWSWLQAPFAIGLLVLMWSRGGALRGMSAVLAVLVGVLLLWLTPALAALGPALDFIPRPVPEQWQEAYAGFMRRHHGYTAVDMSKVLLLCVTAVMLIRGRRVAGP